LELVQNITKKIIKLSEKQLEKVTLIGIDGPTASGKTTIANSIKNELEKRSKKCLVFGLDWTLIDRSLRVNDLENLKKSSNSFEYEAELHMDIKKCQQFLSNVQRFNEREIDDTPIDKNLVLKNLYSRDHEGQCVGTAEFNLEPGMIIILEGHYTLRNELDKHIDYNIVLLGELEEFLQRKVDRVKGYRSVDDAKDYYWRIDVPSFKNHNARFGINADLIVDNTDYNNPKIKEKGYINYWSNLTNSKMLKNIGLNENLSDFIFSNSILTKKETKEYTTTAINMLKTWDSKVGHYIRTSIGSLKYDLTKIANDFIIELNENSHEDYTFRIMHTDALYNVYNRILPLSLSIGLFYKGRINPEVSIVAEVFQPELTLQIIWEGGYKKISVIRQLGEITKDEKYETRNTTGKFEITENIEVMTPTHFTIPEFLNNIPHKLTFIKKEDEVISASQALSKLLHKGGVWIHRFALFSELRFYKDILRKCGSMTIQIGNYLISVKTDNQNLRNNFKKFVNEWETPIGQKNLFYKSQNEMDKIVINERKNSKEFVSKLAHFIMMDGYLFSRFMYENETKIKEAISELKLMMNSDERLLRKRANQFLLKFFPMINLKTHKLWGDLPKNVEKEIKLDDYNQINPSIMAELFMWQTIRNDKSSVLATNIYDIRQESFDSLAYLESAAENNMPIVLQSSLNALGQEEIDEDGNKSSGYLKIREGPKVFINAAMRAARDLYLTKGILPPLFGIGLDHVASKQDIPKGRANRFFKKAYETGRLTHYVQDGAGLFDAKTRDKESLKSAFNKMIDFSVNLVDDLEKTYLIDREICAGELNYVEDTNQALVPDNNEMRLFMRTYQEVLLQKNHLALLSRPMLFIGNLGTTHHGYDKTRPKVETAKVWRDALKNENFISPVLHGTTNSHRDVLRDAAVGCAKINVAGDLLHIFVANLPEKISRIIYDSNVEPKKMLSSVKFLLDELTDNEKIQLINALKNICEDLIKTINSPKLSKMDSKYFHYNTYAYPKEHVGVILDSLFESIEKYRTKNEVLEKKKYQFSASMIEVPEEDMFRLTDTLWKSGIRYFHIDAGDGEFITRKFTGIEKTKFLRKNYPECIMHAHLMCKNPHFPQNGELSLIQQYAEAGVDAIAVHPRAFDNDEDVVNALKLIKNLGKRPGILIETHDTLGGKIERIIEEADLDWVIVMGVPIGYGGQMFQFTTLQLISNFVEYFKQRKENYLVEADGGLTHQTLKLCKNAGAEVFSGWSIIKSMDENELSNKVKKVYDIFNE
jgi:ribulose-phosphate 3-epimerase